MTTTGIMAREIILAKIMHKGWNLYSAIFSIAEKDIAPAETIKNGPVQELLQGNTYILLPKADEPKEPKEVISALEKLIEKIRGKPTLPHGYQPIELLAFIPREDDVLVPLERKKNPNSQEGPYKHIAIPYAPFVDSLDYFLDTRKPKQINYANIDQPIRGLIYKLNQIPFLKTTKSKASRIKDEMKEPALMLEGRMPVIYPEEDNCFLTGGHIVFNITDIFNPKAKEFMADTREMVKQYKFATLTREDKDYILHTSCLDITRYLELKNNDNPETRIRKTYEVRKSKAEKKIKEFIAIRDDFEKIAEKYMKDS